MRKFYVSGLKALACLVGVTMVSDAVAQSPRSSIDAAASPGVPEFRDPKTGQIWTPENVGQGGGSGKPLAPDDRAFDPLAQAASIGGIIDQNVRVKRLGTVPITAGPTVPLFDIDNLSLRAVPAQRWQAVLYLNNNSAFTMAPVINCRFTNAGRSVEDTRAVLPPIDSGDRVGFTVYGPKTNLFVDHVTCRVAIP
jgi:hypothetical protein